MRAIALLGLVRRLLINEAGGSDDQESLIDAAERVSDKLRVHLSKRIGQEGFRTLLARAVTLAAVHFPHLSGVHIGADGSLIGLHSAGNAELRETRASETREDIVEGALAIIAQLLELLTSFIGDDLTLRMLSAVWPELAIDELTSGENQRP